MRKYIKYISPLNTLYKERSIFLWNTKLSVYIGQQATEVTYNRN